ncbi:Cyclin, N-terminal domain containing protein [Trichomonas vaginalis G3]|uniref:Cyclin, N-terminal domain containing protein n=1 Tax=Trichomonas vaginalis (strain ATCC PRA-98 / G3) TaxID=412133 RepID=A2EL08_TRIV3|nr:cell division [Trichomonas vaginalis G3]EAY06636.1 Cyclin, N-terminal domain containing protein [Trichomonas vaginalis G3]KAI5552905.1 cell division [Trichomonas vaginalis G3]|eukprot:XP_001318859.1 Cyclin, N-terminal domain containing protein [Trichomonas vaginalis G3]
MIDQATLNDMYLRSKANTPEIYITTTLKRLRLYDNKVGITEENKESIIKPEMRMSVLEKIIHASQELQVSEDTIFHAVRLFDYLNQLSILTTENYVLYGATSLMLTIKMNEAKMASLCERLAEYFQISDVQQLISTEFIVMDKLEFDAFIATPLSFIHCISPILYHEIENEATAKQVLEISCMLCQSTIISDKFSCFSAEDIAKASISLACQQLKLKQEDLLTKAFGSAANEKCVAFVSESSLLPGNKDLHKKIYGEE